MLDSQLTDLVMVITFCMGYIAIILETNIRVNKSAAALLMAVLTWMFLFLFRKGEISSHIRELTESIGEVSQILFFLLGAMTVVELIDSHKGFKVVTDLIRTNSKKKLLWILGISTFFLSSVLDNLTTTIVIVSLLRKLVKDSADRLLLGSMVVIAANAGGAWTPIGDVTTSMLWIKGNISSLGVMKTLFLPSLISLFVALFFFGWGMKGSYPKLVQHAQEESTEPGGRFIFFCGVSALVLVPVFKTVTHFPPFMSMLAALGILWLITDLMHGKQETRRHLRVSYVLTRIDTTGILFFLGILLCINALNAAGILSQLAQLLNTFIHNVTVIASLIGLISAVIDNVPLVAAGMRMYELTTYPIDSPLWQLLAYCAGTGGSILIIGSAAGVALMSLEKIDFIWYARKAGWIAFLSYLSGIGVYLLQQSFIAA